MVAAQLERVVRGEVDRLMLLMPPRHGKSELASRRLPAFCLGLDPTIQFISTSASSDLSSDFGREVRNTILSPEYKALFSTRLSEDSQARNKWNTPQGGGYYAIGVGGQLMGRGADILLIDDPFSNMADAQSEAGRKNVWDWFQGTVYNRLEPGGRIVIINHRMHVDDLSGRLIEKQLAGGDKWEIVELPAISPEGEALWPEKFPIETLHRIEENTLPLYWSALYQQQPYNQDGGAFQRKWFEKVSAIPSGVDKIRSWDLASTAKGGDYSSGILMSRLQSGSTKTFFVEDVIRFQGDWRTVKQTIKDTAKNVDGRSIPIRIPEDPGQAGKFQAGDLVSDLEGWDITAERESGLGNKEVRANPFAAQCAVGNVKILAAPWNEAFLHELESFPNGKYDDQVDAVAGAFRRLIEDRPVVVSSALLQRISSMGVGRGMR